MSIKAHKIFGGTPSKLSRPEGDNTKLRDYLIKELFSLDSVHSFSITDHKTSFLAGKGVKTIVYFQKTGETFERDNEAIERIWDGWRSKYEVNFDIIGLVMTNESDNDFYNELKDAKIEIFKKQEYESSKVDKKQRGK